MSACKYLTWIKVSAMTGLNYNYRNVLLNRPRTQQLDNETSKIASHALIEVDDNCFLDKKTGTI